MSYRAELLLLAACHAEPPPPAVAAISLPEAAPAIVEAGAPDVVEAGAPDASDTVLDAASWFASRGAKAPEQQLYGCRAIRVRAEDALRCSTSETIHDPTAAIVYRDVVHAVIYAVRAGKVITVLDVPVAIQATDFPENMPLQLKLDLGSDSATLADGAKGCERALADVDAQPVGSDPMSRKGQALDRRLVKEICKKRGTFPLK